MSKPHPSHLRDCRSYDEIVRLQQSIGKEAIQVQFKELNAAHQAALKLMKVFRANPPRSRWEMAEEQPAIIMDKS